MKRPLFLAAALAALAALGGSVALAATPAFVTRYTPAQLGGIDSVLRYTVARPDREETRFVFLSAPEAGKLPEEVQVVDPGVELVQLSDEQGADCTLAHVEVMTGRRAAVISAVRVFSAKLEDNDLSAPGAMDIQLYRPRAGEDPGESRIVLRASGPPKRSAALCDLPAIRRAMLAIANKER